MMMKKKMTTKHHADREQDASVCACEGEGHGIPRGGDEDARMGCHRALC
jgi:hypothetical protein